jgi:hypothetical protein
VLFIGGLAVLIDTGRRTSWHHLGNRAMTAGVVLAVSPRMNRRGDASYRKRRLVLIGIAVVTVAAFLSVKLLR